jgi:predicted nucleic acid-binding protein
MATIPSYYWDTCVFLHIVSPDPLHPDRRKAVDYWLSQAEAGAIRIITSTLTIAEVAFSVEEKHNKQLDQAVEDDINALWLPGGPVTFVEYSRTVGINARSLIRSGLSQGRVLKPYDAVHLASAVYAAVDETHSYDQALGRYGSVAASVGFALKEPPNPPNVLFSPGMGAAGA